MTQITLGILVVHIHQENGFITEMAMRSTPYHIKCVRFEPTSIDPTTLLINGERFDGEKRVWEQATFPIPEYLYDRCFYHRKHSLEKVKPIVEWLKKNPDTFFLGVGLPDKWTLYQTLKAEKSINCYLPATEFVQNPLQIIEYLKGNSTCILKPIAGSRGVGILAVTLAKKAIKITYHKGHDKKNKEFQSIKEFTQWSEKLLQQKAYLLQPLLPLHDKKGYPFDIRLFIQKNERGQWDLVAKGIRKGFHGSFLSNLTSGGDVQTYDDWAVSLTEKQRILLEDDLQTIIDLLPPLLEKKLNRLFEIGLDIGYAKDGSVWILDINSKPGRKTVLQSTPMLTEKLYEAPLAYCHFLSRQSRLKESN